MRGINHQEAKEAAKGRQVDSYNPQLICRFPDPWSNVGPENKEEAFGFFGLQHMETFSVPYIWEGVL